MLLLAEIVAKSLACDSPPIGPVRLEGDVKAEALRSLPSSDNVPSTIQDVKIGNHTYRFPVVENGIQHFGPRAAEIMVPGSFMCSIKSAIDPKNWPENICNVGSDTETIYFSMPDQLYQWRTDRLPGTPPVRGPVKIWREMAFVKLWQSLDPEIHKDGLLYVTFDGRTDIYGECNEAQLDWSHSCNINWFDGTMIHHLSVPAKWLENAPAAVDEYKRRILPTTKLTR